MKKGKGKGKECIVAKYPGMARTVLEFKPMSWLCPG